MYILIAYIIPLILVIILLFALSMVWPPDSPWAPWWRTNKKIADAACKLANINSKDILYELGSGDAQFLIHAAQKYRTKGVGIEIDPLRVFVSKLLIKVNKVSDKVTILKGNFFDYNISDATVVFVYLVPKALERLKPKLLKELKPETYLISLRYNISLPLVKEDKKNKLYLYKIPKGKKRNEK